MPSKLQVFDTTLRDGSQREGISYSVDDKLAIAKLLDRFGVGFIEGGWPGAMPKDTLFFQKASDELFLQNAELVAFGATRKANTFVEDDSQVLALLAARTSVVTIVAKSDILHVHKALRTNVDENMQMLFDTITFLRANQKRVFVDLEHFFDGLSRDTEYGIALLQAAQEAGAETGILCDTNGGMLPLDIYQTFLSVGQRTTLPLGIHAHNDTGCAVANTISAVCGNAVHFQGTANGYGERTGNANLFTVIADLQLKLGMKIITPEQLSTLTEVSRAIAEIANLTPATHQPYAGVSSFSHKAGLHASALKVNEAMYSHIDPKIVGSQTHILVSEMAGRSSVILKAKELGFDLSKNPNVVKDITQKVKVAEEAGASFEAADASLALLIHAGLNPNERPPFTVKSWRVIGSQDSTGSVVSEAVVKLSIQDEEVMAVGEGVGPVDSLDAALRKVLSQVFPGFTSVRLTDYKVRIINGTLGTAAITRVLVSATDGRHVWSTVGVSNNVLQASWSALLDSVYYALLFKDI